MVGAGGSKQIRNQRPCNLLVRHYDNIESRSHPACETLSSIKVSIATSRREPGSPGVLETKKSLLLLKCV